MECGSCGADNDSVNRFCSACGVKLVQLCASCSFENSPAARFCGGCGTILEDGPSAASDATAHALEASARLEQPAAERRQITVMFCDLVGSTELSSQIDPEELSEVYRIFRSRIEQVMDAYEGHVAEYLGDGIVAYFGYPMASENAAERCVRAALSTIEAIEATTLPATFSARLSVRIGIATGLVVAGDLLGSSNQSQVRTVVGETPNLAARLQGVAEPNTVVISPSTRSLVLEDFVLEACEPVVLKGIPGEVIPYVVRGIAPSDAMRAAIRQDRSLIGRGHELALITSRWQDVLEGHGQILLISGEPGMGKSRLIRALNEQLREVDHLWLTFQASNIYQNTAFYPVIDLLRTAFDFTDDDVPAAVERLADALVTVEQSRQEVLPLFCELLSVPYNSVAYSSEDGMVDLSAEARRQRIMAAITGWVMKLTENQPVVLIAEDLHWIDPSTLELLATLVAQSERFPLLLVATFRSEFRTEWHGRPNVTSIPLQPLKRGEIVQMVAEFANGNELPRELLETVVSRTDGVPLFVEQLTRAVIEESDDDRTGMNQGSLRAIPSTLQDSLMARLDRLGSAKDVAQKASVIGRDFSYEVLLAISALEQDALDFELKKLVDAQLVFQQGIPPQASYSFRHALIQDTAYQSLLNRRRQGLHGVLAEVLTTHFPEVSAREPEIIALHYAQANQIESAIPSFLLAGQRARERSALREAVSHLRNGLEWLKNLPEGETRDRLELTLLLPLSGPLIATSGYSNPEVEQVCARAFELCNAIGAGPDIPFAIYGLTTYYLNVSNLPRCREVSEMLMLRSEEPEYELHRVAAHSQLAFVHFFLGNLETSLEHSEQIMATYQREDIEPLAARYGQDPGPTAYAQASLTAWQLGYVDRALEYGREAWSLPEANNDPFTQAAGGVYLTLVHVARRERQDARRVAERTLELCEHQNFVQWGNQAKVARGWALADGSETTAEGINDMRAGLEQLAQVGAVIGAPMFTSLLIEALMIAGVRDLALATVSQTLSDSKVRGNVWMDAELLRLKAQLLAEVDQPQLDEVRELLDQSIAGAQKTGSRIYEVRSLCAAHRFGIATDADYLRLAELDAGLSEGRDTVDLQAMTSVLAERG